MNAKQNIFRRINSCVGCYDFRSYAFFFLVFHGIFYFFDAIFIFAVVDDILLFHFSCRFVQNVKTKNQKHSDRELNIQIRISS